MNEVIKLLEAAKNEIKHALGLAYEPKVAVSADLDRAMTYISQAQALALLRETEKPIANEAKIRELLNGAMNYFRLRNLSCDIGIKRFIRPALALLAEPEKPVCEKCGDSGEVSTPPDQTGSFIVKCTKCPPKADAKARAEFVKEVRSKLLDPILYCGSMKVAIKPLKDLAKALDIIESMEVEE